jgi:hypothetical protein
VSHALDQEHEYKTQAERNEQVSSSTRILFPTRNRAPWSPLCLWLIDIPHMFVSQRLYTILFQDDVTHILSNMDRIDSWTFSMCSLHQTSERICDKSVVKPSDLYLCTSAASVAVSRCISPESLEHASEAHVQPSVVTQCWASVWHIHRDSWDSSRPVRIWTVTSHMILSVRSSYHHWYQLSSTLSTCAILELCLAQILYTPLVHLHLW